MSRVLALGVVLVSITLVSGCGQNTPDLNAYLDDPANGENGNGFSDAGGLDDDEDGACGDVSGKQCVPEQEDGWTCDATSIAIGVTRTARTTDGTDTVAAAPCEAQTAGSPDRAFVFKAPVAGQYVFAVTAADFDTVLHVRKDDCTGSVLACNDDGDDVRLTSRVLIALAAHETVVAVVDGFAGATGAFSISVTQVESSCDNGEDDDGDGRVDCDDPDCADECVDVDEWPADWVAYENDLLAATNAVRVHGATCGDEPFPPVAPLTANRLIRNAARAHALDMAERDYFDHVGLDGSTFDQRMARAGYRGRPPWGENLVANRPNAQTAIAALMASEGHCRNIMNEHYRVVGIGYAYSDKSRFGHIAAQNFGGGD